MSKESLTYLTFSDEDYEIDEKDLANSFYWAYDVVATCAECGQQCYVGRDSQCNIPEMACICGAKFIFDINSIEKAKNDYVAKNVFITRFVPKNVRRYRAARTMEQDDLQLFIARLAKISFENFLKTDKIADELAKTHSICIKHGIIWYENGVPDAVKIAFSDLYKKYIRDERKKILETDDIVKKYSITYDGKNSSDFEMAIDVNSYNLAKPAKPYPASVNIKPDKYGIYVEYKIGDKFYVHEMIDWGELL